MESLEEPVAGAGITESQQADALTGPVNAAPAPTLAPDLAPQAVYHLDPIPDRTVADLVLAKPWEAREERAELTERQQADATADSPAIARVPGLVEHGVHPIVHTPARTVAASAPAKPWEEAPEARAGVTQPQQAEPISASPAVNKPPPPAAPVAAVTTPLAPARAPDLVQQAAAFLRHPSMRDAPSEVKRSFMASKGLSPAHIDEAVQRAGLSSRDVPTVAAPAEPDVSVAGQPDSVPRWVWPTIAAGLAAAAALGVARLLRSDDSGAERPPVPAARADPPTAREGEAARCSATEHSSAIAHRETPDSCAGPPEYDSDLQASLAILRGLSSCAGRSTSQSSAPASRLPAFRAALADACTRLRDAPHSSDDAQGAAADASPSAGDGTAELIHALHTLTVVLNSMLLHPSSSRFRRIAKANTNMRRLVTSMPHVLDALGFVASASGGHWEWRAHGAETQKEGGGVGGVATDESIGEADLAELRSAKALLQRALAEAAGQAGASMGMLNSPADAASAQDAAIGTGS